MGTEEKNISTLAILTISDMGARGQREDTSGRTIREVMSAQGFEIAHHDMVPDEKELIQQKLKEWCDGGEIDLVLTTGGTGLGPRDVTPEATTDVIKRPIPGIAEAMRMETLKQTPLAMISRAVAGVRGRCLIINLPGSPKAVRECLEIVLPVIPHTLEVLKGQAYSHPTS